MGRLLGGNVLESDPQPISHARLMTVDGTVRSPLVVSRDLGPRGSRADLADPDSIGEVTEAVGAVLAAVPAWWHARAQAVGLRGPWLDVRRALAAEAPAQVTSVSPDPAVDQTLNGFDLGAAYVHALTPQVRARHGRHYTPADLATQLWTMARSALGHGQAHRRLPGLVRDPACGAGSLLLPALHEHLSALARTDPEIALAGLPAAVEGIDADPAAVWLANVVMSAEALPVLAGVPSRRRQPLPALARVGDGLAPGHANARVVVMNPPYGRVRLSPHDRDRFAHVLYGHANLYSLFLAAGLECLDQNGVLAALIPTSFTAGRYFTNLRKALAATAPLRDVVFVEDRSGIFTGVLQETCLTVFTKRKPQPATIASLKGQLTAVAKVKSPRSEGPWLLPRRSDDAPVAAAAAAMPLTLTQAGWKVSTGPLVWNRRRDDLHSKPSARRIPVLWAADMDGGRLHRDPSRDAMRYLQLRDEADRSVMALAVPAVLVQRTTAPEQSRRLVAMELTAADLHDWGGTVVVENHVNVLRPAHSAPLLSRPTLARILSTSTMDRLMRCLAGSVAVSAYELESMPLPPADVLASWEHLHGPGLETSVANAYRPGT